MSNQYILSHLIKYFNKTLVNIIFHKDTHSYITLLSCFVIFMWVCITNSVLTKNIYNYLYKYRVYILSLYQFLTPPPTRLNYVIH